MGFHTTVSCYREGPQPPIVTGADLADFCQRIVDMDICRPDQPWSLELKYGHAITKDSRSTYRERRITDYTSLVLDYDWDVDEQSITPEETITLLQQPPAPRTHKTLLGLLRGRRMPHNIYRAKIYMGGLRDEYTTTIQHQLEGNWLYLGDLSFSIDVVEILDTEGMNSFQVGWMSLRVSGSGYSFPWSYEETLQRIRQHPQLAAMRELCRTLWPASKEPINNKVIKARQLMEQFLSEPLNAPYDWYWVIQGCV